MICESLFLFSQKKQPQHHLLIILKTITIMDYVVSIGISKMPKIPDKSTFHFFMNQAFRKDISTRKFNPAL
jgi:hypothetical protein